MAKNGSVPSPGLGIPNIVFFAGAYLGMALLLLTAAEKFVQTVTRQPEGGGR
jgi:TRAP-type C4-dicarboxylate transport system permease small subunit